MKKRIEVALVQGSKKDVGLDTRGLAKNKVRELNFSIAIYTRSTSFALLLLESIRCRTVVSVPDTLY